MAKLTVHHLDNSRSQRVLWLLEELGLEYDIETYKRDENMRAPRALRQVHPLGKAPIVTHGARVLAESGAVVEYIIDELGEGRMKPPAGTDDYQRYRYFLHFAEGSLTPPLLVKLIVSRIRSAPVPFFIKPIARGIADKVDANFTNAELDRLLAFVESSLEGRSWLAGDEPTGADVMMSFPCEAALARAPGNGTHPNLRAYVERIHARPAFQRALERGGPYDILG